MIVNEHVFFYGGEHVLKLTVVVRDVKMVEFCAFNR